MNAEGVQFVDPEKIIHQVDITPGATVADFGCGAGYFSFAFSRAVGPEGKVFALDILPSALEAVTSRAKLSGVANVVAKRVNLEREGGSGLGLASVDWVILKDMLFQNEHKEIIMKEVARVMKPSARAIIVEWNPKASAVGPEKKLRIDPAILQKICADAGLIEEKVLSAGGYHYAFLVKKA